MSTLAYRFKSLFDQGAWFLIVPAAYLLHDIDQAMFATVWQWLLVASVLAGLSIIVSRIVFPQVQIAWLVGEIKERNLAAGLLAAALVVFVGMIFLGLVLWARP